MRGIPRLALRMSSICLVDCLLIRPDVHSHLPCAQTDTAASKAVTLRPVACTCSHCTMFHAAVSHVAWHISVESIESSSWTQMYESNPQHAAILNTPHLTLIIITGSFVATIQLCPNITLSTSAFGLECWVRLGLGLGFGIGLVGLG